MMLLVAARVHCAAHVASGRYIWTALDANGQWHAKWTDVDGWRRPAGRPWDSYRAAQLDNVTGWQWVRFATHKVVRIF